LSEDDRKRAQIALDTYKFPVMSYVIALDGTIIHKINANDLLDESQKEYQAFQDNFVMGQTQIEDPIVKTYKKFLLEGLDKAKN
jgi:hypothetical protein